MDLKNYDKEKMTCSLHNKIRYFASSRTNQKANEATTEKINPFLFLNRTIVIVCILKFYFITFPVYIFGATLGVKASVLF